MKKLIARYDFAMNRNNTGRTMLDSLLWYGVSGTDIVYPQSSTSNVCIPKSSSSIEKNDLLHRNFIRAFPVRTISCVFVDAKYEYITGGNSLAEADPNQQRTNSITFSAEKLRNNQSG